MELPKLQGKAGYDGEWQAIAGEKRKVVRKQVNREHNILVYSLYTRRDFDLVARKCSNLIKF